MAIHIHCDNICTQYIPYYHDVQHFALQNTCEISPASEKIRVDTLRMYVPFKNQLKLHTVVT